MPQPTQIRPPVESLDFDPQNPRFFDAVGDEGSEEKAVLRMIEQENLEELVGSIGNQGFFPGEPLLVTPKVGVPGRWIVVEGNRRLAALRVLRGIIPAEKLSRTLQAMVAQANFRPDAVECFEFPARRDVLKYLGFRHISGPRRWEPLSKARYLEDLIRNFYSELSPAEQLRAVARDIGSQRPYVAQLLTALHLYDRAKEQQFYGLQRVGEDDISFSLLSTALSYSNIVDFLNLPSRESLNVDMVNDQHAKELLSWMFAQDQRGATVLGESRRLKVLAAVVGSDRALVELRRSSDLDQAYIFSSGPGETFTQLLSNIDAEVASSIALLGGEVEPDETHLALIEKISTNLENLHILTQKSISRRQKRSRLIAEGLDDA